jgi:hypothetical protein
LHYYYRLHAVDQFGNASGWATTDVVTLDAPASGVAGTEGVYVSSDHVATVRVPNGAMSNEVSCAIAIDNFIDAKPARGQVLVAGPYALSCKTATGTKVTDFNKPVSWTFNLKDKLTSGKHDPVASLYDIGGAAAVVKDAEFDSKNEALKFNSSNSNSAAVMASLPRSIVSPNLVVFILATIGIVIGIIWLVLRHKKKLDYEDYLRSKYYNL